LMIQQTNGQFIQSNADIFNKYAMAEDVDAIFFDANGDGTKDLLVVSGGNESAINGPMPGDRLFLNNGQGQFTIADNAIPGKFENRSCVQVADIDKDGDMDIFIGTLSSPTAYGLPQTSYLYLNDGKAHFTKAGEDVISLNAIGIITASSFTDINKDGWTDLIVTGEWMPVITFINQNGKFKKTTIGESTGLWQTIYPTDVNGDGFIDILAGNWGHNSKLWSGKNGPLKLYIKDFDNNGSLEQVMAYTVNKEEFPFLAKDELERALPVLKKAYLKYSDVAGKTIQYMFYDLFKNYTELRAETLSNSCFINDGKGNFERMDLPDELQLAPIMSFTAFGPSKTSAYWAGGNFYGVNPY
jgi:enediyne biosynthesis protein E4